MAKVDVTKLTNKDRGLLYTEWKASGKTQAAFCKQKGIPLGTFKKWIRFAQPSKRQAKVATPTKKPAAKTPRRPTTAVARPAEAVQSPADVTSCVVQLKNRRRIVVPKDFDEGSLKRLIKVLET